jgi:hypothetical protein
MLTASVKYSLILILVIIYVHLAIPFHQSDTLLFSMQHNALIEERVEKLYITFSLLAMNDSISELQFTPYCAE